MIVKFGRTALMAAAGLSMALGGAKAAGLSLTLWHNTQDTQGVLALYKAYERASGNKLVFVDIPADGFPGIYLANGQFAIAPDWFSMVAGQ